MILIPAIDLKNGLCVRLRKGNINDVTVFSKNPEEVVLYWLNQGARRLHIVDLDGAFSGLPKNYLIIKKILKIVKIFCLENNLSNIPVQLGGGIRNIEIIEDYFKSGISNIILGTAAIKDHFFLQEVCKKFFKKIIVSLDVKDGLIAINGWDKLSSLKLIDFANNLIKFGCNCIIYTDIEKDGMLQGVNLKTIYDLAKSVPISVIASGGVRNIEDIKNIYHLKCNNIIAVICGRSIYEGTLNFKFTQNYIDNLLF